MNWGTAGTNDGQFDTPTGIAMDSSGFIYVCDSNNNRIQKFTADGQFVTKWGSAGSGDGQFNGPLGIAVDPSGYVYLVDSDNSLVQVFAPSNQSTSASGW